MLLRLNFLGSQGRATWLRADQPSFWLTPRRPSFINGRTDSIEYAWFIWGIPGIPTYDILPTEKDAQPAQPINAVR